LPIIRPVDHLMRFVAVRHLWGVDESWATFLPKAKATGYEAIEVNVLELAPARRIELVARLGELGLGLVAQIFTNGFIPGGDVATHVDSFRVQCEVAVAMKPRLINCHSGRDAFTRDEAFDFFRRVVAHESGLPVPVAHELHRGRVFCAPWSTTPILDAFPTLKVTADFSHWVNVCERLIDDQLPAIRKVADHCVHLHARVGHAQGPQVNDPRAPEWAAELAAHERWWDLCWSAMAWRGVGEATLTPEFGPPSYQPTAPFTRRPLADLAEICDWMMRRQRERFAAR
jgi:sugar phosphate isomerase/epimerase